MIGEKCLFLYIQKQQISDHDFSGDNYQRIPTHTYLRCRNSNTTFLHKNV